MAGLGQQERWFPRCCWGVCFTMFHTSLGRDHCQPLFHGISWVDFHCKNRQAMNGGSSNRNDFRLAGWMVQFQFWTNLVKTSCFVLVTCLLTSYPPKKIWKIRITHRKIPSISRESVSCVCHLTFQKGVRNPIWDNWKRRSKKRKKTLEKLHPLKLTAKAGPWKLDGWNTTTFLLGFGFGLFSGAFAVSFREGTLNWTKPFGWFFMGPPNPTMKRQGKEKRTVAAKVAHSNQHVAAA